MTGLTVLLWTWKLIRIALASVGLITLILAALIAVPVSRPPWLPSISNSAGAVDRSDMPPVKLFQARDGTALAFRHYPAQGAAVNEIAVVVHGSSGSSAAVHALARALAERGVETFAPDERGHGFSGTRGDIAYRGQLQDDLADLVGNIRRDHPTAPLVLIGHSSGGGFVLRMAGSPIQDLFSRTVLLAPFLGYREASNQPGGGGWAQPDFPRIWGLMTLNALNIHCCDQLPVLAFAVPPHSEQILNSSYSLRLLRDFGPGSNFRDSLSRATHPIALYAGANDELMASNKYQQVIGDRVPVKILDGVDHMGIVSDVPAVNQVADDIARMASKSEAKL